MPLRSIGRKLQPTNRHRLRLPPKIADPELQTPEHKAFRKAVLNRAGWRCEWVDDGVRCTRSAATGDRMIADHVIERADGGSRLNPDNGQCLCVEHNTRKGIAARAKRRG